MESFVRQLMSSLDVLRWPFVREQNLLIANIFQTLLVLSLNWKGMSSPERHHNFYHTYVERTGYFMTLAGLQASSIWVCSGLHKCSSYPMASKKDLRKPFKMEEIEIPLSSLFIRYGYVQHAAVALKGYYALCYLSYLMPDDVEVKHAVALVYGASLE